MEPQLQIYAVNTALDLRHTYLSRANGDAVTLPNLAGWLGLRQGGLNTDEIELFPLSDLADMPLSSYVATAFDILDEPLGQTASRLNALSGHVLLIPGAAIAGDVKTGPELTLVASLPMARPDHSADALQPTPPMSAADSEPEPVIVEDTAKRGFSPVLIGFVFAVLVFVIANFL